MSILQVNGAEITAPKTCKIGISDQDYNSDTDSNGNLHRNRVAIKEKYQMNGVLLLGLK